MRFRTFLSVSERAKLCLFGAVVLQACALDSTPERHVVPSYDQFTSRLVMLAADQNGDARLDQWTYLDGNAPLRGEADQDGDGRIDRWEYFGSGADLLFVGSSSQNDGIEDTRTWIRPQNGEGRVDRSQARDRLFDRREFYKDKELVRAELDTNADGLIDQWDRYEAGRLRVVDFDTTLSAGRANWRIAYDAQGKFVSTDADLDGDGRFAPPPPGERVPVAPPGGKKR